MSNTLRISLILPSWGKNSLWNIPKLRLPSMSLALIAALTPSEHEVSITDESIDSIDFSSNPDLVGISVMTSLAPRAYEIADRFRATGTKVVLGGIHPTFLPEEALEHADAVVVGPAEHSWPKLVSDASANQLQRKYLVESSISQQRYYSLPRPRWNLFQKRGYVVSGTVQATRGCPFKCDFCSVTAFWGSTYRCRPVAEVIEEVLPLRNSLVFFIDDNIVGYPQYAKELFAALIPLKIKWIGQASINIASDKELLRLAADSGCIGLFIGFESVSQSNLKSVHKHQNKVEEFDLAISSIHDHEIGIEGAFVFGLDYDEEDIFDRTLEFVSRNHLEAAQFSMLTPFPGTELWADFQLHHRITSRNWALYDASHLVFDPIITMSPTKLLAGYEKVWKQCYSLTSIASRMIASGKGLSLFAPLNLGIRKASRARFRKASDR